MSLHHQQEHPRGTRGACGHMWEVGKRQRRDTVDDRMQKVDLGLQNGHYFDEHIEQMDPSAASRGISNSNLFSLAKIHSIANLTTFLESRSVVRECHLSPTQLRL